ncbi:MAG: DUF1284 domain-containing protein [Eubacterium sp.]
MKAKIRYHHLMCIPRFTGRGYSDAFCKNMYEVIKSFDNGNYELVDCCDDICKECPNRINGKCADENKVLQYDKRVKACIESGTAPLPSEICSDCRWYDICKNINI